MNTRFLSWPYFVSSVGRISFPQLAEIRFLSWPCFTSSVGRVSFPQLAEKLPKEDYCCMKKLLQATQD